MGSGFAAAAFAAFAAGARRCVPSAQAHILLLLLLLLLLPCSRSCCLCLLRLSLLPCLLGGPALVAAPHVPTTPMFLFERNPVLRNTNSCFCSLFTAKGIALKTHKVLLPCSACLLHKEQGIEDKRSAARRPVPSSDRRARDLLLVGSARARLLGVGFARRLDPLSSPFACGPRRCGSRLGFLLPLLLCLASELLELPFASCALTSVLARGVMPKKQPCAPGAAGRWGALCI